MALGTLVDFDVLLDVFTDDPRWGGRSAKHLARAFDAGPVAINPLIYAELSLGFDRSRISTRHFRSPSNARICPGRLPFWPDDASCNIDAVAAPADHRCLTSTSLLMLR